MASYTGTAGDDTFTGGSENDSISGGAGSDTLAGGAGADTIDGGAGDDSLYSADAGPYVLPYAGSPFYVQLPDTGAEPDTLIGGEGSDRLYAGYGDNVDGGANDYRGDTLFISLQGAPSGVTADFGAANLVIGGGSISAIENLGYVQGSRFGDNLNLRSVSGDFYINAASGMEGNDTLTAGRYSQYVGGDAGDDVIDGRLGIGVRLEGGDGADTIYTAAYSTARVDGGSGDDSLTASGTVHGGPGNDVISQLPGGFIYGDDGDDRISVGDPSSSRVAGGAGADTITGGSGADSLYSGDLVTSDWSPEDDLGTEHDVISAGSGDDKLAVGYGDDADGGAGVDSLRLSLAAANHGVQLSTAGLVSGGVVSIGGGIIQNIENVVAIRGTEFSDSFDMATQSTTASVQAGAGDDVIVAHGSAVEVSGGDGDDRFISGAGQDIFFGGAGFDIVDYGAATSGVTVNLLTGQDPDYIITDVEGVVGSAYADTLTGDLGANQLIGGEGDDRLEGGSQDTLTGGAGADAFVFDDQVWHTHITDFQLGVDRVDLSAKLQQVGYTGADPIRDGFIDVISDNAGGAALWLDPDGNGAVYPSLVVDLEGVSPSGLTWTQLTGGVSSGQPSTIAISSGESGFAEGNSGATPFVWTLSRAGDTSGTATAHWTVRGWGDQPADAADFAGGVLPSGDVTFAPGETSKTMTLSMSGDTAVEPNDEFQILLSNVQGAARGTPTMVGYIMNDDTAPSGGGGSGGTSGQVYTASQVHSSIVGGSGNDTINGSEAGDTLTGGAGSDLFHFGTKPWEPTHITDFTVGADKLDLSALLQQVGYTGSDPIGDKYIQFADNGAGGTKVLFDRDGAAIGQQWPDRILELDNGAYNPANASQMLGTSVSSGGSSPAPASIGFPTSQVMIGHNEGDSGNASFTWTVTRDGDTSAPASVQWWVTGSGANPADGADFAGGVLPHGNVSFAAGETSKTLSVYTAGDTTPEADEDFTVTLSNPNGASLGKATITGRIMNDDAVPSGSSGQVFTATQDHSTIVGTAYSDTINGSQAGDTLTGGAGSDLFRFASKPWEPTHITDFTVGADKLDLTALLQQAGYTGSNPIGDQYISFADNGAGGTKVLFDRDGAATGQQWPDRILELDNLAYNPANASQMLGTSTASGGGTGPAPTVIALESKTTTQAEGNSGLSIYSYTLTRSGDLSHSSSVSWAVTGSGANPASAADFENGALPSGNFIFAAGEASKQIFFKVAGDATVESDEQFTVTLSGPSGATLGNATAQGVITNDDAAPGGGTGGTSGQVYTASDVHSTMSGTAGNDTFNASQAADTITGGAGADLFHFGSKPWEPAHITDFQVGADKLDLSALLQQVGYTGSDPLADQYIQFADNGAGGTKVLFDRDGAATGQQWPDRIIELDHLAYNPANSSQILGTSVGGSAGGSTGGGSTGGGSTGGGSTGGSSNAGQVFTSASPETVATGTAGNDTFNASQGADTLTGGGGADVFNLPTEPWSPIHITDFTPGTDKIDLSHLLKAVGYAGTDPVADHYIYIGSDGADGSIIRFDRDGAGPNPQWPNTIIDLEHVAPAQVSSSDWIVG